jgi:methionyl-tRNA synthetase
MYVWLDALTNYLSATNYFNEHNGFWPTNVHIIGKDILRFHSVYWPAFLMAAKIPLPKQIFGHGWILSGDEKMSKSKGNILDPIELINEFGSDEIRYYLMKEVIFGLDGKINLDNLKTCINDLANNIGNLSNRLFTLISKYYDNKIPDISQNYTINESLILNKKKFVKFMDDFEIHNYVKEIHSYSSSVNKYVNDNAPWDRKNNSEENIKNILFSSLNALKNIFVLLYPIIPNKSKLFLSNLNISEDEIFLNLVNINLQPGTKVTKPEILFKKY